MNRIDDDIKIGAREASKETRETTRNLKKDRTLLVTQLTHDPPIDPKVAADLKSVTDVFAHFKPAVSVDFEKEDGQVQTEEIHFNGLSDFGPKGITQQSEYLMGLQLEKEFLGDMIQQLKSNKTLKAVLENTDSKKAFLEAINQMIEEIPV